MGWLGGLNGLTGGLNGLSPSWSPWSDSTWPWSSSRRSGGACEDNFLRNGEYWDQKFLLPGASISLASGHSWRWSWQQCEEKVTCLRRSILRKDNPKTKNKILVNRKISKIVWKLRKSVRKLGTSVRKLVKSVTK